MKKIKTTELTFAALMTALMCILSQIAVPVPFAAIVFNLGFVGIFLAGALQKPRAAFLSILAYVLLGAAGVPVFANFKSGIGAVLGPTGGFIIAYPIAAFLISFICGKAKNKSFVWLFVSMLAGGAVCYIIGTLWYMIYAKTTFAAAFAAVAAPFIITDSIKAFASSALCLALLKIKNRIAVKSVSE
ncbi:MAG: biotin transporter BioY [Ruminococcus sp.]|jgi:biotin transport system substrate-specific component|nr:biotin transporter BioY [Ruminococcus sp.]